MWLGGWDAFLRRAGGVLDCGLGWDCGGWLPSEVGRKRMLGALGDVFVVVRDYGFGKGKFTLS